MDGQSKKNLIEICMINRFNIVMIENQEFINSKSIGSKMTGNITKKKIVVVDDFEESCQLVCEILSENFDCTYTSDSTKALSLIKDFKPDLVILDHKMPGFSGIDLCRMIRSGSSTKYLPVLFISGEATVEEKLNAFELGADDFLAKPYHNKELVLRVKARLVDRKSAISDLNAGNLKMNLITREVFVQNESLYLTPKQFEILKLLVENKNNLVSRENFMKEVWPDTEVSARNVDSQINYIKRKIEKFEGRILSIPGQGYRLTIVERI